MLSYCSIEYLLVFLPIVFLGYQILPQTARRYFLLAASYGFFWYLSGPLVVWHVAVCLCVWLVGLRLQHLLDARGLQLKEAERSARKGIRAAYARRMSRWVIVAGVVCFGILLSLKYTPFFTENLNSLFRHLGLHLQLRVPSFAVPIGISFYTLQAMSYVFDVQKEKL